MDNFKTFFKNGNSCANAYFLEDKDNTQVFFWMHLVLIQPRYNQWMKNVNLLRVYDATLEQIV